MRYLASKFKPVQNRVLMLLGCAAAVDTYLRFQIAMETVEKFVIRTRRGEAINLLGDRIWNILFLLSSLLVLLLIGTSIACNLSGSVEDGASEN